MGSKKYLYANKKIQNNKSLGNSSILKIKDYIGDENQQWEVEDGDDKYVRHANDGRIF